MTNLIKASAILMATALSLVMEQAFPDPDLNECEFAIALSKFVLEQTTEARKEIEENGR